MRQRVAWAKHVRKIAIASYLWGARPPKRRHINRENRREAFTPRMHPKERRG